MNPIYSYECIPSEEVSKLKVAAAMLVALDELLDFTGLLSWETKTRLMLRVNELLNEDDAA